MVSKRRKLLNLLRQTSFHQSETPFRLASGAYSRLYVDCKKGLSYPEIRRLIADDIYERIKHDQIDAIGGLEIGAYPIATAVSDKIFAETGKSVRVFVVRKEPKKHGIRSLIAGSVNCGDRVLIVDDVITSGSSAIQAIEPARKAGLTVERVIALVDREESNGKANIEAKNVRFECLFTLAELAGHGDDDQGSTPAMHHKRVIQAQSRRRVTAA